MAVQTALAILNTKAARTAVTSVVVVVCVVILMLLTKAAIQKIRRNNRLDNLDNPDNADAAKFYNLFFPFGEWAGRFSPTDEEKVIELARQIGRRRIDNVSRAYRIAYNRYLIDDIRKYLDGDEQAEFFQAIA